MFSKCFAVGYGAIDFARILAVVCDAINFFEFESRPVCLCGAASCKIGKILEASNADTPVNEVELELIFVIKAFVGVQIGVGLSTD